MGCLTISTTPSPQPVVAVEVGAQAEMSVELMKQPSQTTEPIVGAKLTVGEVCVINSGRIVVFAGSDGPFRTRGGGFFLLDPATNPPED